MEKKKKRIKIKYYNIFILLYTVITLYKYFIFANPDIIGLTIDLLLDAMLGMIIYTFLKEI